MSLQMEVLTRCWFTCAALCIAVGLILGSAESANRKESETLAPEDIISYYLSMEIMNRVFNDSLLDPESPDYKKMYSEVDGALYSVFGCQNCSIREYYEGVTAMTFRKGSVIADLTMGFSKAIPTNPIVLKFTFIGALNSKNEINGLQINPKSVQDAYITTTKPPTSTTRTTTITTTPSTTTTPTTTPTSTTPPRNNSITTTPTTTPTSTTPPRNNSITTTPTTTPTSTTPPRNNSITTTPTTKSTTLAIHSRPPTSTTQKTASKQSSRPSISHLPKDSTSTQSFSSTINNHSISSSTTHNRVTNKELKTEPSPYHDEGVPDWAIALLVLAAIAILLLLIIIIILLVRWCCVDNSEDVRSLPPQEHTPYMRTTFREPLSVPAYSPHTPQRNLYPFDDLPQSPRPKPNRTGTYVVNPEK